ncbi:MAG: hypothetical protein EAX96_13400 [Candidatus Lokiarchaeota archaeon]|nr:hypothetical protein [Candidatus Lokiarchaeota archaeon]
MVTGVFFHHLYSQKVWHIINDKFRNFPEVMEEQLKLSNVKLITPRKVTDELLLKVHTPKFLKNLKNAWYCEGAYLTVGGCVEASELIMNGELTNALCFGVAAGHHAERDSAWGGTYASVSGPIIVNLQEKFPDSKIAIIDTDSHHANGTRNVTFGNSKVLHVCFCSTDLIEDNETKICVNSGYNTTDEAYLELVKKEFISRIKNFKPDIIIHLLGHDTARGDYGSRGLSKDFFLKLVQLIKDEAECCSGRYLINTHGGSNLEICEYIFPRIIQILSINEN